LLNPSRRWLRRAFDDLRDETSEATEFGAKVDQFVFSLLQLIAELTIAVERDGEAPVGGGSRCPLVGGDASATVGLRDGPESFDLRSQFTVAVEE